MCPLLVRLQIYKSEPEVEPFFWREREVLLENQFLGAELSPETEQKTHFGSLAQFLSPSGDLGIGLV